MKLALAVPLFVLAAACEPTPRHHQPASEPAPALPAGAEADQNEQPPANPGCRDNFAAFDDDHDGLVSQDEFGARPHALPDASALFSQRDADSDGKLAESEFCSGWRPHAAMHGGERGGPPWGGDRHAMGMHAGGPKMGSGCESHFETFDADGDDKVTAEELAAWPHAWGDAKTLFEARDGDRDGVLTLKELCATGP